MDKPVYRCPYCGNSDLILAKETTTRKLFKMGADGKHAEFAFETVDEYSDDFNEFLECQQCNHCCDFKDGPRLAAWKVINQKF